MMQDSESKQSPSEELNAHNPESSDENWEGLEAKPVQFSEVVSKIVGEVKEDREQIRAEEAIKARQQRQWEELHKETEEKESSATPKAEKVKKGVDIREKLLQTVVPLLLGAALFGAVFFATWWFMTGQHSRKTYTAEELSKLPWFRGGTLHHVSAADWQKADARNRLATAADFVKVYITNASPNPRQFKKVLRRHAEAMVECLNSATEQAEAQTPIITLREQCLETIGLKAN